LEIYPGQDSEFSPFLKALNQSRSRLDEKKDCIDPHWFLNSVVYCLYVDRFGGSFNGCAKRLDYLQDLGVNCLWLLPILDSPMLDEGFDVRDYFLIRKDLLDPSLQNPKPHHFHQFLNEAKKRGISIIFDLALNHCSKEHPYFQEASKTKDSPYRDYFIWSRDAREFQECRVIFKGLVESNWTFHKDSEEYYFHRFYPHQPDWNYRNPRVLFYILSAMLHWKELGIHGYRMDAVPYLWKEEGTNCENLPTTHTILKFLRACCDYVQPGTLLLAEACQPPQEVVHYFSGGDEVQGAYHFPLMPRIYLSLVQESTLPLKHILDPNQTPPIPEGTTWFTFLRCHDELTLEMVSPAERDELNQALCRNPDWSFREGEGISARLADLLNFDTNQILLAHSLLLTIDGVPILYYGDEFGQRNQVESLAEFEKRTGQRDSRALVRGALNWSSIEKDLSVEDSFSARIFYPLRAMLQVRTSQLGSLRGSPKFYQTKKEICVYSRFLESGEEVLFLSNLSSSPQIFEPEERIHGMELIRSEKLSSPLNLAPFQFYWIQLEKN